MKFIRYFIFVPFWVLCLSSALFGREIDSQNRESPEQEQDFSYDQNNIYNPSQETPPWTFQDLIQSPQNLNQIFHQNDITLPAGYDDETTLRAFCRSSLENGTTLESKLNGCPRLANHIIWETGSGERIPYPHWPLEKKQRLEELFRRIQRNERNLGVDCPSTASYLSGGNRDLWNIYYTERQAFDNYAAHLAHVLHLEGRLPWSILSLPPEELAILVASYHYHTRIAPYRNPLTASPQVYRTFMPGRDFQRPVRSFVAPTLSCDPRVPFQFVTGMNSRDHLNLLGATEEETLMNITWWFHNNASHYPPRAPQDLNTWIENYVYFNDRLTKRIIRLRSSRGEEFQEEGIFLFNGCHQGANLALEFARSVNIPLLVVSSFTTEIVPTPERPFSLGADARHMGLVFRQSRENKLILWHADNLYSELRPIYPIREDGTPLDFLSDEVAHVFFQEIWLTPEELESRGFRLERSFPLIVRGEGLARFSPESGIYDFGYLAGFWSHPSIPRIVYESRVKQYALCSHSAYLSSYCLTPSELRSHLSSEENSRRAASMLPPAYYTADEFYHRAAQCVSSYGGCNRIGQLYRIWFEQLGSTYLAVSEE